ncbi:hypothetical protein GM658_07625 [Pseudoduganella eburnea]|uniref:Uncharacterized protein n=1 Tax=Massilia eburnea TaxID=1776165 RepID=A0A6L6QE95_9BURK|nr:hypothetical protein [Massilia eburnea]MTW10471.1 hypothetical protein [Massilia eburnea]
MELPNAAPDSEHEDHEARIVKLEKHVQDLSTGLQSLSQQLTVEMAALKVWFSEKLDQRLEEWRKENERKLEDWRKENDRKLEDWRKENDHKLEDWRKENDHKLEDWRQGLDQKLDGLRKDTDRKLMWMIGLAVALLVGLYFR